MMNTQRRRKKRIEKNVFSSILEGIGAPCRARLYTGKKMMYMSQSSLPQRDNNSYGATVKIGFKQINNSNNRKFKSSQCDNLQPCLISKIIKSMNHNVTFNNLLFGACILNCTILLRISQYVDWIFPSYTTPRYQTIYLFHSLSHTTTMLFRWYSLLMCRMPTQVHLSITKINAHSSSSIGQINGYAIHQICTTHKGVKIE